MFAESWSTALVVLGCLALTRGALLEPEVFMNTTQLIRSKGYPCEEHDVHTQDGYILGVQRIPQGKMLAPAVGRPVVLLQHGLLSASACWVENLANNSLGFMMADAGFDVWLGNSRGNTYSKRHEKLSSHDNKFWSFSWDEMAQYDLPATVDYIIARTGASQIFYVGHSQGAAIAFAQLSHDKALEGKIKLFAALAPAVYLGNMVSPVKLLAPFISGVKLLVNLFGTGEFMPSSSVIRILGGVLCNIPGIPSSICDNVLFAIAGYNAQQLNASRVPVYVGQHPAGTSSQNIVHYAQSYRSKKFQKYDHGFIGNLLNYLHTSPPQYHLENVRVPVLLYSGTSDWLVTPTDVNKLVLRIPNLVKRIVISGWEHLDFIWAMNAPELCYNDLISVLKSHV